MMALVGGGMLAQTPPGFSPSSNEALGVRFGDSIVANGTSIPPTGKLPVVTLYNRLSV